MTTLHPSGASGMAPLAAWSILPRPLAKPWAKFSIIHPKFAPDDVALFKINLVHTQTCSQPDNLFNW